MVDIEAIAERARAHAEAQEGPFAKISAEPWDWRVRQPEWMLDRLVPAGSIGMIYGPSNSGKSHLVCDIIASMVAGRGDWQGIPMRCGDVVMFSESIGHIRARLKAYLGDREPEHDLYSLPTMALELPMIFFLAEWLKKLPRKPMLIVFDTLATMFAFEENDNREASRLIKALEELILPLIDPLGAIIILHHTSKVSEGKTARGASALIGNIDFSWNVQFDKKAELTIAQWEKDRWRLFTGCTRWAGKMRRVPVEFENASAEMSILDWSEYSEEVEEMAKTLETEGRMQQRKADLERMILANQQNRPFVANPRCKPPVGFAHVNFPKEWSRDAEALRQWLRDEWRTEPVYSRSGNEVGIEVLGRKSNK